MVSSAGLDGVAPVVPSVLFYYVLCYVVCVPCGADLSARSLLCDKFMWRYGRHQPLNHPVEEDEAELFPSVLERREVQLVEEFLDAARGFGVVVPSDEAGCPPLLSLI